MYQRYYKQRKFGRVFSFVLVIGSGLTHYIKSSYSIIKNTFKLENVLKCEEYFPQRLKSSIHELKEISEGGDKNIKTNMLKKRKTEPLESFVKENKWMFSNKLKRNINYEFINKPPDIRPNNEDDLKARETYLIFKNIKNKLHFYSHH